MKRKVVGITLGDPAGIGPEITVKACGAEEVRSVCAPVVIGDPAVVRDAARAFAPALRIVICSDPLEAADPDLQGRDTLCVYPVEGADLSGIRPGALQEDAGRAAFSWIEKAIELALAGKLSAVCTGPVNKEALHLAGHVYPGQTEIFAEKMGAKDVSMMLASDVLRVSHVTTHISLADVPERVTRERVETVIDLTHEALRRLDLPRRRVAVAGLNPHAGENGIFGDHETRTIAPAVQSMAGKGIDVVGPLPPDSVFLRASRGEFDAVVAMYHDQGHIPVKLIAFDKAVNVTLGLPVPRTSVDHGTAFDIAGKGIASAENMIAAIRLAAALGAPVEPVER